jgi:hypothetical protein
VRYPTHTTNVYAATFAGNSLHGILKLSVWQY